MKESKCKYCNEKIKDNANFCHSCGKKIRDSCNCWVKKRDNYKCGFHSCPGTRLLTQEKIKDQKIFLQVHNQSQQQNL